MSTFVSRNRMSRMDSRKSSASAGIELYLKPIVATTLKNEVNSKRRLDSELSSSTLNHSPGKTVSVPPVILKTTSKASIKACTLEVRAAGQQSAHGAKTQNGVHHRRRNKDESLCKSVSSAEESIDSFENNSISVIVSTIETQSVVVTESNKKKKRAPKHATTAYPCHLKTLNVAKNETLRMPLRSSMNWIEQFQTSTGVDLNDSIVSSIRDLGDIEDSYEID